MTTHKPWSFRCPKCGGSHFGSTSSSHPARIYLRWCHDQFNKGCRWRGYDDDCDARTLSPQPVDVAQLTLAIERIALACGIWQKPEKITPERAALLAVEIEKWCRGRVEEDFDAPIEPAVLSELGKMLQPTIDKYMAGRYERVATELQVLAPDEPVPLTKDQLEGLVSATLNDFNKLTAKEMLTYPRYESNADYWQGMVNKQPENPFA